MTQPPTLGKMTGKHICQEQNLLWQEQPPKTQTINSHSFKGPIFNNKNTWIIKCVFSSPELLKINCILKSLCIPETTKKKITAIILWSFNDPRIPKGTVTGLFSFSVFEHEDMKLPFQEAAVLGKFWLPNQPSRSIQHTVATRGTLESRINTTAAAVDSSPGSTRPRGQKMWQHRHRRTQRTMNNEEWVVDVVGAAEDTPPTQSRQQTTTHASLGNGTDRTEMM